MSPDKHSWDRVPAWDGDKRQWKRYLRDVELYLETEKLDVDFSRGARLLSRLTGSARKHAETIELDQIRRSTGTDRDTREGMTAGVKHVVRSLERAMGMEEAARKGEVQEFFYKKLQRRPGQPMAELVNIFEKAVLDMKAEGQNVELKSMDWHLFGKAQFDPRNCPWHCGEFQYRLRRNHQHQSTLGLQKSLLSENNVHKLFVIRIFDVTRCQQIHTQTYS